jgi:isoamylase
MQLTHDANRARVASARTYHYWHVFVPDVRPGQIYGCRVQGPVDPANGMRFDPAKVLLDPNGRGIVVPKGYSGTAASESGDNAATAMKSVVVDPGGYDWEGDTPLRAPSSRTIISTSSRGGCIEELAISGFESYADMRSPSELE